MVICEIKRYGNDALFGNCRIDSRELHRESEGTARSNSAGLGELELSVIGGNRESENGKQHK